MWSRKITFLSRNTASVARLPRLCEQADKNCGRDGVEGRTEHRDRASCSLRSAGCRKTTGRGISGSRKKLEEMRRGNR